MPHLDFVSAYLVRLMFQSSHRASNSFTFTSFMRLSCCSTTSNGVYCSARRILHFEWSEHEMMQGERCVVNLNRDVCWCSLLCRLLSFCSQSEYSINSIEVYPYKGNSAIYIYSVCSCKFCCLCVMSAVLISLPCKDLSYSLRSQG